MGKFISGFLSTPITDLVKAANEVIGQFVTSPEQKLQAELQLSKLESDFRLKTMDADIELSKAQADVIKSEATSQSWAARNWRPILMLTFNYIILHNYVLAPLFHLASVPLVPDMWDLLKLGITGYIGGRTIEKVAPDVIAALKK